MGLIHQGRKIAVIAAELGISEGEFAWTARFQIATPEDYQRMRINDDLAVTIGGEIYTLIVDGKELYRSGGRAPSFIVTAISPTARHISPRATLMDRHWDAPVLARVAAETAIGQSISWDLVDWWIPGGRLSVTRATPMDVVKAIAAAAGGMVATRPDGTLSVRHAFPVAVPNWSSVAPQHVLTDTTDNLSSRESFRPLQRVNRVVVRGYLPTSADLSISLDDRDYGLNVGRTSFHSGETAHLLVHAGPEVNDIQASSSAGGLFRHPDQVYPMTQDLVFNRTNLATLDRPALGIYAVVWLGCDLGGLSLAADGRSVTAERSGVAIARVSSSVRASAFGLSSPQTIADQTRFPIHVHVTGTVKEQAGDGEVVCQRGTGEYPGEDISDPLLVGVQEMLSRGRAEIDAGEDLQEVQLSCVFRPGIMPGHLVEVHDALMGRSWRGKVTGVRHIVQAPKVTTSLDLLRPTP